MLTRVLVKVHSHKVTVFWQQDPAFPFAQRCSRAQNLVARVPSSVQERHEDAISVLAFLFPYAVERQLNDTDGFRFLDEDMESELSSDEMVALLDREEGDLHLCLRRFRNRQLIRLCARELQPRLRAAVGRELAALADACLQVAIDTERKSLEEELGTPLNEKGESVEFAAIAMGKHGARELNFCSDIDLLFVYETDEGTNSKIPHHEFFSRLAKRVTSALSDVTADGFVFRVDLRLRPEGNAGPLVNSFESLERYYETWGNSWDRLAWLKGRASAGNLRLGIKVCEMLQPFVYARGTSTSVVEDIVALNQKIKRESSRHVGDGFDLKNGRGGLRDIEFFVQALQLLHGGRERNLRVRDTRTALVRLFEGGYIGDGERTTLAQAYEYLRYSEHLLQMEHGRQTQSLPAESGALRRHAEKLGIADIDEFQQELSTIASSVAAVFETLEGPTEKDALAISLLSGELAPEQEEVALDDLCIGATGDTYAAFVRARTRPNSPFRPSLGRKEGAVAKEILLQLAAVPNPTRAMRHYARLLSRRGDESSVWKHLARSPRHTHLLTSVFGASDFLANFLLQHPEHILFLNEFAASSSEEALSVDAGLDEESFWNELALSKSEETLRIALGDLSGRLDLEDITLRLSELADEIIRTAWERVVSTMGHSGLEKLCILALGKCGGQEMGYSSDLDLVFVYEEGDPTVYAKGVQRFTRMMQALHQTGRLYPVDTRLRPGGGQGTLVLTVAAWEKYHRSSSEFWEAQALTKLRVVAGDSDIGQRVKRVAEEFCYNRDWKNLERSIQDMRIRQEKELVNPGRFHLKYSPGGICDIEFAVQFLQLKWGQSYPEIQVTNVPRALHTARKLNLVKPEIADAFVAGYRFLRQLELAIRLVDDKPHSELAHHPRKWLELSRRLSGLDVEQHLNGVTKAVRTAYSELFSDASSP